MRLLPNPWVASLLGAAIYGATTLLLWRPQYDSPHVNSIDPVVRNGGISWKFQNPEIDQLVVELRSEKEQLARRDAQLNELAARLAAERAEINQVTQLVHRMQQEFDRNVVRIRDEEVINLKKLAKTYAAMTPDGAAKVIAELDDAVVVSVARYMKDSEIAPILDIMAKRGETEAKRAAIISDRLRLSLAPPPTNSK